MFVVNFVLVLPSLYPIASLPNMFCQFLIKKVTDFRNQLDRSSISSNANDVVRTDVLFQSFYPINENQLPFPGNQDLK